MPYFRAGSEGVSTCIQSSTIGPSDVIEKQSSGMVSACACACTRDGEWITSARARAVAAVTLCSIFRAQAASTAAWFCAA